MRLLDHLRKGLWVGLSMTSPLCALDVDPWIRPPYEWTCGISYLYTWQELFQSPAGSFDQPGSVHQVQATLELTPLPRWDLQLGIDFAADSSIPFAYAATHLCARYQFFDETKDTWISLVPGIELIFAQQEFLEDNNFYYIGPVNILLSCALGKSFYCKNQEDWVARLWFYQAYGFASQGKPWITGAWTAEWKIAPTVTWAWFSLFSFGTGQEDIIAALPFTGYGSIDYQFVDLYTSLSYDLKCGASFSFCVYHNLYARNSSEYYYGGCVSLQVPFISTRED